MNATLPILACLLVPPPEVHSQGGQGGQWELLHGRGTHSSPRYEFLDTAQGFEYGDGKGLRRTLDGGETWSPMPGAPADTVLRIFFLDRDTGWALEKPNRLHRTRDGGRTWTLLEGFPLSRGSYFDWDFLDGGTAFLWCADTLYSTLDGGSTWKRRPVGARHHSRGWKFVSAVRGFQVQEQDSLWMTEDSGATWKRHAFQPGGRIDRHSLYFKDARQGWYFAGFGTDTARIFRTADGGATWTGSPIRLPRRWGNRYSQGFARPWWCFGDTLLAMSRDDRFFLRSEDGGRSWAKRRLFRSEWLIHSDFVDSRHGWLFGEDFLFRTRDGGHTWKVLRRRLNGTMDFTAVHFADSATGWALGFEGDIVRTADGGADLVLDLCGFGPVDRVAFLRPGHGMRRRDSAPGQRGFAPGRSRHHPLHR